MVDAGPYVKLSAYSYMLLNNQPFYQINRAALSVITSHPLKGERVLSHILIIAAHFIFGTCLDRARQRPPDGRTRTHTLHTHAQPFRSTRTHVRINLLLGHM